MLKAVGFVVALWAACLTAVVIASSPRQASLGTETIYVRNVAPQYISDATIKRDIPAWQDAINKDFAPAWHTARVRFVFIGRGTAPKGAIAATFVDKGPVKGALAYHTVSRGVPAIIVYAGTDDYYGYSNSVSFTHEAEELLADPEIAILNQGHPYPFVTVGAQLLPQGSGTIWANEVSDPVEAFHYERDGVAISDFITPNWFNDEVNGPYDFMQLVQTPFTILKGGYAQYWDPYQGWVAVTDFRHAGRDANGFLIAEKGESRG